MTQGILIKTVTVGVRRNIILFQVQGFVDTNTCAELRKQLNAEMEQGHYYIIVDLGAVSYVSSAGWGVFVGEIRNIQEQGGDLKIVQMMPEVLEVFRMLEFDQILSYYENIEESINDFDLAMGNDISQVQVNIAPPEQSNSKTQPRFRNRTPVPTGDFRKQRQRKSFAEVTEAELPLVEKIRLIIVDNPSEGLWTIRRKLKTQKFGMTRINPLRLHRILKKNAWDTREKRIRYYRSR